MPCPALSPALSKSLACSEGNLRGAIIHPGGRGTDPRLIRYIEPLTSSQLIWPVGSAIPQPELTMLEV
jgi:hypothetical protein